MMGAFVLQPKLSKAKASSMAEEAIQGIENFFSTHPRKRVCVAGLFYGEKYKIKRKDVRKQVLDIVQTLVEAGRVD